MISCSPCREGGMIVKHVYAFSSQRVKDNWLRTLRFAGTKLGKCSFLRN